MINQEAVRRIENLINEYEKKWGKRPTISFSIPNLTQEKLEIVLERIVETGESILVGCEKCFLEKEKKDA